MAKGRNNKKQNNGYFARNTQQFGNDFLLKKTAKDIQFDLPHICRDIAHSDPELGIPKMVKYFMNMTFVMNLSQAAYAMFCKHNATFIGLQMYINNAQTTGQYIDPSMQISENMIAAQHIAMAYQVVCTYLNNIVSLFNMSADEDWLRVNIESNLKSMSVQLSKYKRVL